MGYLSSSSKALLGIVSLSWLSPGPQRQGLCFLGLGLEAWTWVWAWFGLVELAEAAPPASIGSGLAGLGLGPSQPTLWPEA